MTTIKFTTADKRIARNEYVDCYPGKYAEAIEGNVDLDGMCVFFSADDFTCPVNKERKYVPY